MTTTTRAQDVAEIIIQQLGGKSRMFAMVAAYNFCSTTHEGNPALDFRFRGSQKYNYCRIALNDLDTYDVYFSRIWGMKQKNPLNISGIYYDMLIDTFTKTTKLDLSLGELQNDRT